MTAPLADADLVERALGGSKAAFDELVDKYWHSAVALARQRTRNWADAQDAAQEAFVLAYRKLGSLRDSHRFGGWLFTIVARSCIEVGRRNARRPTHVEDIEVLDPLPTPDDSEHTIDRSRMRDEIADAIEALPERYRPVIVLRYGQGMDVKSIATTLSMPLGTVVSQIFRANRILRTRLRHLVNS